MNEELTPEQKAYLKRQFNSIKGSEYAIGIYLNHDAYAITTIDTSFLLSDTPYRGSIIVEDCFYTTNLSYKSIKIYLKNLKTKHKKIRLPEYTYIINEDSNHARLQLNESLKTVNLNISHALTDMKAFANDSKFCFQEETKELLEVLKTYEFNPVNEVIKIEHRVFSLFISMNHIYETIKRQNYWNWVSDGCPIPGYLQLQLSNYSNECCLG